MDLLEARTFFVKEGEPDFLPENRHQKTFDWEIVFALLSGLSG